MGSTFFVKRIFKVKHKPKYGRGRAKRPKTFKSEETAKKWAEAKKIANYRLVDLKEGKKEKKIRIVVVKK